MLGELGKTIACDVTAAREVLGHRPAGDLVRACAGPSAGASTQGVEL